ncbi:hypothetical protein B0H63DRAFT_469133, partial [Podospora didyma]
MLGVVVVVVVVLCCGGGLALFPPKSRSRCGLLAGDDATWRRDGNRQDVRRAVRCEGGFVDGGNAHSQQLAKLCESSYSARYAVGWCRKYL